MEPTSEGRNGPARNDPVRPEPARQRATPDAGAAAGDDLLVAVSGRITSFLLETYERLGVAPERLAREVGAPVERLRDPQARLSWGTLEELLAAIARATDPDLQRRAGAAWIETRWMAPLRMAARLYPGPATLSWLFRPDSAFARHALSPVAWSSRRLDDDCVEVTGRFPAGLRAQAVLIASIAGALERLAARAGGRRPRVDASAEPPVLRFVVSFGGIAPGRRALGRLLRGLGIGRRLLATVEELYGLAFAQVVALEDEVTRRARAEARYRAVFAASRDGIAIVDREGHVLEANRSLSALLAGEGEADAATLEHVLGAELAAWVRSHDGARWTASLTARRPDGDPLQLEVTGCPLEVGDGGLALVVLRDVTSFAQRQQALRAAERRFLEAQRTGMLARLAGGIAHDLENLLTAVGLSSGFLRARAQPADRADLDVIDEAVAAAHARIEQLRGLAEPRPDEPRHIDAAERMRALAAVLERLLPPPVEIRVELHDAPAWVHVDPTRLEQAVVSLALNARDAMAGGGPIGIAVARTELRADDAGARLRGAPPGRYVAISVADTGVGMDAATAAASFEPFFTTHRDGRHAGLGLATVRATLDACGGDARVLSRPGKGTVVTLYLPESPPPDA